MSKGKGKAAAVSDPETQEEINEATETVEETTEPVVEQPDYKAEAEKLRQENEDLRARNARQVETRTQPQGQPAVTTATLRALTAEQRAALEEQTGRSFADIISEVAETQSFRENSEIKAKLNVAEALEEEAQKDPQTHKLKVFMREYLNDVPVGDRADSEKLARHVAKAKVYAKGRLAEKGGYRAPVTETSKTKSRGPDEDSSDMEDDSEQIKAGDRVDADGLRFIVSELGGKAAKRSADLKHPKDPNGIMFRGAGKNAFDKPPIFRRGE